MTDSLCLHIRQIIDKEKVENISIETDLKEYLAALPDRIGNGDYTFTYRLPIDLSQPGDYNLDSYIAYMVNGECLDAFCIQIQRFTIDSPALTGINETVISEPAKAEWYDLNGRRLSSKPTSKGVYIYNGRKYIIK